MNRMLLVVFATSALVFSGIIPTQAEITPYYNPTNAASPTGFTTGYKLYRTIGCPAKELLGLPCPIPAPDAAALAKSASVPAPVAAPDPVLVAKTAPVVVLAKGLPLILGDVNFNFDSDKLLPQAERILDLAVEDLKSANYPLVQINGHTDSTGPDAYNVGLSERRALSVKEYLVDQGIPADTLTAWGYGEIYPVVTNSTKEGRYQNRRVELHITE